MKEVKDVFVVRNQHGLFASKHKEWVDGREPKLLFRSEHHDEAINLVFELSSKDIYLRASAIGVALDDKKQPIVEVTAPPPAPDTRSSTEDTLSATDEAVTDDPATQHACTPENTHSDSVPA